MIFAEANVLKNLDHKNIVKMINCYIFTDMRAVFIMEYLSGVFNKFKGRINPLYIE
jgi:hypothetical protein